MRKKGQTTKSINLNENFSNFPAIRRVIQPHIGVVHWQKNCANIVVKKSRGGQGKNSLLSQMLELGVGETG